MAPHQVINLRARSCSIMPLNVPFDPLTTTGFLASCSTAAMGWVADGPLFAVSKGWADSVPCCILGKLTIQLGSCSP
jgi:hypothetical protein